MNSIFERHHTLNSLHTNQPHKLCTLQTKKQSSVRPQHRTARFSQPLFLLRTLCSTMRCFHWWRVAHDLALCIHKWSSTSQICSVPLFNTSERWSSLSKQYPQQSALHLCNHHRFIDPETLNIPTKLEKLLFNVYYPRLNLHVSVSTKRFQVLIWVRELDTALPGICSRTTIVIDHHPSRCQREDCGCISTDTFTLSLMTNWVTAMTGKLAEKLPLTMSSLINTIPDSLYPEEDIPTSMNIFTNTDSISHYSQMNTGTDKTLLVS